MLFCVFTLVVGLSAYVTFTLLVKAEETVIVPDLLTRDVIYCLELLTDMGLDIKVKDSVYDEIIPKNHVIYQQPEAGQEIKKGRDVQLVISKGKQKIFMPDLRRLPLAQALIIIEENDLRQNVLSQTYTSGGRQSLVLAQSPKTGSMVNRGTPVNLLVSLGPRPRACIMPDLIGSFLSSAILRIEEAGLSPGEITSRVYQNKPENTVAQQEPAPGERVLEKELVKLVVNREAGSSTSRILKGRGGVRLFQYKLEKGLLNRHIKVVWHCFGMAVEVHDKYWPPGSSIRVLIPAHRDATVLLYEDGQLIETEIYSSW